MPSPVKSPGTPDAWRWKFEVPAGIHLAGSCWGTLPVRAGVPCRFVLGCLLFYILYVLTLNIEINHPDSLSLTPLHLDQFEPDEIVDGSLPSMLGQTSYSC